MRRGILFFLLAVILPLVSSFITYTLVTLSANPIEVDDTGALIITIILIEMLFLSGTGIFPIDLNQIAKDMFENTRKKREIGSPEIDNATLYQVPEVVFMPCSRRFLCEIETAAKTSDNYLPQAPKITNGRNLSEEVAPDDVDPISELQIEAVRALFREEDPMGELSERGKMAVAVMEGLTGTACEEAYRLCPGRHTSSSVFKTIFEELNFVIHDEL